MIKDIIKKLNILALMLVVAAGIICFPCGFAAERKLPKNVTINGVEAGGLKFSEAARAVRENIEDGLKEKTLKICAGNRVYSYAFPEIYYKDNLANLLKSAQKGDSLTAEVSYYLCGAEEIAAGISLNEDIIMTEPYAEFSSKGEPFKYHEGNDGKVVDKAALMEDIKQSLKGGFQPVKVKYKSVRRQSTLAEVKSKTSLLTTFTTYYDGTNLNRASNIRLAAAKLNGTVIEAGKTLSFNDIVGARVKERGFLPAKIIEKGEFVEGVGGGVCQVSTTLYNAALLSGLKITEYHPHSLAVGYVPPSRDAMVSGDWFDLKILNTRKTPVYIRANTTKDSVTFTFYGESDGAEYSVLSEVTGSIPAPEELTEDPLKAREGKDGLLSEGYLEITRGGFKKTVLLRKDKYQPVKRMVFPAETVTEEQKN